jgi:hypothetical protein
VKENLLAVVRNTPGLTDREITDRLLGPAAAQQAINQIARLLAAQGALERRRRPDGKLGNYPPVASQEPSLPDVESQGGLSSGAVDSLSEDDVKRHLQAWLENTGWKVTVIWGRGQGIDIDAARSDRRWIIEAKGRGSLNAMRVNYFLGVLGELLQRMSDPEAKYSIALPDLPQFRRLWERLPELAKRRTTISALFVSESGHVEEVASK